MSNLWVLIILAILIIVCTFIIWLSIDDVVVRHDIRTSENSYNNLILKVVKKNGETIELININSLTQTDKFTEIEYTSIRKQEVYGSSGVIKEDKKLKIANKEIARLAIRAV